MRHNILCKNKKKIFSLISTCMVEKFYYKKFTQHITMLNLDTIHKDYTNTFLIKKEIQTRTTFYKGLTTLNKMNNYIFFIKLYRNRQLQCIPQ